MDMFHIVQLISGSLNKITIKIIKNNKYNYRKMKRYLKLLLKPRFKLDCSYLKKQLTLIMKIYLNI